MPATRVKSRWVNGNLVFYDTAGDIIFTVNGVNRNVTFPTTGTINLAAGSIDTADLAAEAVTKTEIASGVIKVETAVIDASGGDGDQDVVVLPANSAITDVHVLVTTGFDGDANQTIDIGIGGNTDKYLATADIETAGNNIADNDEEFASTIDKAPVSEPTGETVVATWTNNASAAAGEFRVSVSYYVEDV